MTTHLQNNSYKKFTGRDLTAGFSACKANTVSLSYIPCYVRMARHCHRASYVVAEPFTNMLVCVFFMSDAMKSVNPFLDGIPRELHEQYMTDCITELIKMPEINKSTDDSAISIRYGLTVAFARKS